MKRFPKNNWKLKTRSSLPLHLAIAVIALFILGTIAGCGSNRTPSDDEGSAVATADVQATVEVAVAATVSSREGSGETTTNVKNDNVETNNAEGENDEPEAVDEQTELMQWVTANTRHYIGDPNAPVVFIEFSDFQ